jgi:hypothetical protein
MDAAPLDGAELEATERVAETEADKRRAAVDVDACHSTTRGDTKLDLDGGRAAKAVVQGVAVGGELTPERGSD